MGGNDSIMWLCLPVTKTENDEISRRCGVQLDDTLQQLRRSMTPPEMIPDSLCWRRLSPLGPAPATRGQSRYTADWPRSRRLTQTERV